MSQPYNVKLPPSQGDGDSLPQFYKLDRFRDSDSRLKAFTSPGGYPIYYFAKDGGIFCPSCANGDNNSHCLDNDLDITCPDDKQWIIVEGKIHWDGDLLICGHCNDQIESAYGLHW